MRNGSRAALVLLFGLQGCVAVAPQTGFKNVQDTARARLHADVEWREVPTATTNELPQGTLSLSAAVQYALLNNPEMQAVYEHIGLAEADFVAAGTLPNPGLSLITRFPDRAPHGVNIEFDILGSLVDLLMRPAKLRASALSVDAAVLEVSAEVLRFAARVERAYLELQGALHKRNLLRQIASSAEAGATLAQQQRTAGNLADLPLAREQALAEQAQLAAMTAELAVTEANSELARLLGLADSTALLEVPVVLPELPPVPPMIAAPEALALQTRLDLSAAQKTIEQRAALHQIVLDWRWLHTFDIGVTSERETDLQVRTGPQLEIALPIFDRKQAELARTAAELRQQQQALAALMLKVRAETQLAARRLIQQHAIARRYHDRLLPLQTRITALNQQQYAYQLAGAFDVLASRKEQLQGYSDYVDALTGYWIAAAELRQALGGQWPATAAPASSRAPPAAPRP